MFYSTLCLKTDAYFQNLFELNTAEYTLLQFTMPHLEADSVIKIVPTRSVAKQIGILSHIFGLS